MMSRIIPPIFFLLLTLPIVPATLAIEKAVEADGESHLSKEAAIRQAQRLAVEKAVGVFVLSETEIENFRLKKDKVFSHTEGYISHFDVIEETKIRDVYKVRISAAVLLDKIRNDLVALKILLDRMERPTILVLVEEDYQGMEKPNTEVVQTEISRMLTGRGFDLVDRSQLMAIRSFEQSRQALSGNGAVARDLGLGMGAQYVIVGKAVARNGGEAYPGTGLQTVHAEIDLRLVQTQTGSVLGSVFKSSVTAHINPQKGATAALMESTRKAVDEYLMDTISGSFQNFINNGAPIRLTIREVRDFQDYRMTVSSVQGLDKVVSSKNEGWNKEGGILVIGLQFKGTSEELATLMDGRNLGEKSFQVLDLAPEKVTCRLMPASDKLPP